MDRLQELDRLLTMDDRQLARTTGRACWEDLVEMQDHAEDRWVEAGDRHDADLQDRWGDILDWLRAEVSRQEVRDGMTPSTIPPCANVRPRVRIRRRSLRWRRASSARVRRMPRPRSPRTRRAAASSRTAGTDPGGDDPPGCRRDADCPWRWLA